MLPGAQGVAFLFGVQQSEYSTQFDAVWGETTDSFPGGISLLENHPHEYYTNDKGYWAPDWAMQAYYALQANSYIDDAAGLPSQRFDVTGVALLLLAYNSPALSEPIVMSSAGEEVWLGPRRL